MFVTKKGEDHECDDQSYEDYDVDAKALVGMAGLTDSCKYAGPSIFHSNP